MHANAQTDVALSIKEACCHITIGETYLVSVHDDCEHVQLPFAQGCLPWPCCSDENVKLMLYWLCCVPQLCSHSYF